MARVAPNVPAETDLLCERCGYTLNGLPAGANCPECGTPVEESIESRRQPPVWEIRRDFAGFVRTSAAVIFRPRHFYRTFTTRGPREAGDRFGTYHFLLASFLIGVAGYAHADWYNGLLFQRLWPANVFAETAVAAVFVCGVFALLKWVTNIASRLTNWEATYRGIRLTVPVVRRGLAYHGAHYLPVGLIAFVTVVGFRVGDKRDWLPEGAAVKYLWTLSAEVVLMAGYLFNTYWIGMRNMMYANQ